MHQKNSFDLLRLIFSLLVLISHSFVLAQGKGTPDYFQQLTGSDISLSAIGVYGFFIISGYLVYQSLVRSDTVFIYLKKRALRIFPGLAVSLAITLITCVIMFHGIIGTKQFYTYIPENLSLYKLQFGITGVFSTNPFPNAINGSLWTIAYEFTFYILLSFLLLFKAVRVMVLNIAFLILTVMLIFFYNRLKVYDYILSVEYVMKFAYLFCLGAFLSALNVNISFPLRGALNKLFTFTGDLSYGIYIYAFPVQQSIVHLFPGTTQLALLAWSLCVTLVLAFLSWRFIEYPALKLK